MAASLLEVEGLRVVFDGDRGSREVLRDVFDVARQEFDVDPSTLERDLLALVRQLAEKKLLSVD